MTDPNAHRMRKPAKLLAGCSMALALAALSSTAMAQSFQGTGVVVEGSAGIVTGAGTTDIGVTSPEVVIDWTPFDTSGAGTIDFQPTGTTANFTASALQDFTVLNRILPVDGSGNAVARAISLDGTVNSFLPGSPTLRTGAIWFYSPTGIILGQNASFNVGSLVLTTNDITFGVANTGNTILFGPGNTMLFRGPVDSAGFIQIDPGAQINAAVDPILALNSYVAMVAPRIVQGGTVSANGGIAYVAAEQANIAINAGLFDIQILAGTTDPNGVVHTGTSTGPASTGLADQQIVTMMALPKNTALTMLLGGNIGYAPAASAANDGSAVVLSAGYSTDNPLAVAPNNLGSIDIGNVVVTNVADAFASDSVTVAPVSGTTNFQNGTTLFGQNAVNLLAGAGETIQADLFLNVLSGEPGTGGAITIDANGGAIGVADFLNVNASSAGTPFFLFGLGDGIGGTIDVSVQNGFIGALATQFDASGIGADDSTAAFDGFGGAINFTSGNQGTLLFPSLLAFADGVGGQSLDVAGDGFGGNITLLGQGGLLSFDDVSLIANGVGGLGTNVGGSGTGGQVLIDLAAGTHDWVALFAAADAIGALPQAVGAQGGQATSDPNAVTLSITGSGSLNIQQAFELSADAENGYDLAVGLSGQAGGISVDVSSGGALTINGVFLAHADASFATEGPNFPATTTPDQFGGTVAVNVDGGSITAIAMDVSANAEGRAASTSAGIAFGGDVSLSIINGGNIDLSGVIIGNNSLQLFSNVTGDAGSAPADAFGGTASLLVDGGSLTAAQNILVAASANTPSFGFVSGDGPDLSGGTASVRMGPAGGLIDVALIGADASANTGLNSVDGIGGDGIGGDASILIEAGTLDASFGIGVFAQGEGGDGGFSAGLAASQSGDGFGGTATLRQTGGTINVVSNILVQANGVGGGRAAPGGAGQVVPLAGDGRAGIAEIVLDGGILNTAFMSAQSLGLGGTGADDTDLDPLTNGGDGGDGFGGSARIVMNPGSTAQLFVTGPSGAFAASAGQGGQGGTSTDPVPVGGNGGDGTGGLAEVFIADGEFDAVIQVVSVGTGGNGEIGGTGTAGIAAFRIGDTLTGARTRTGADLALASVGFGGTGTTTAGSGVAGETMLDIALLDPAAAPVFTGQLLVQIVGDINPAGNGFTGSISGGSLSIGGNATINTGRDVSMTIAPGALLDVTGTLDIDARQVTTSGAISSGSDATIIAPNGIAMTDLAVGGATFLQAVAGPVAVTNDLASIGQVTALGTSVNIRSLSTLDILDAQGAAGDVVLTVDGATGDLLITQASATGAVDGSSTNGSVATSGTVDGNSVALTAGSDITIGDLVSASTTVDLTAGGLLTTNASVTGTAISASSSEVDLAAGSIGSPGLTQTVDLINNSVAGDTFVGGADMPGEYSLTQAELDRVFADNAIGVTGQGTGTVFVADTTIVLGPSGNLGDGGTFALASGGDIQVDGQAQLITDLNGGTLALSGDTVSVTADTGSIVVADASGTLSGTIDIGAASLIIASTAAQADIASAATLDDINARLGIADGAPTDAGYLQADSIAISVAGDLFIQNSGVGDEFEERRGFTANSLVINTSSASDRIVINGVIVSGGSPATGLDTTPLITINGAAAAAGGQFDPRSTVNGCVIGTNCNLPTTPPVDPKPKDELTDLPGDDPDGSNQLGTNTLIEVRESEPLITPPLVDEPITGVGNDDLWLSECEPDREEDACVAT